MTPAKARLKKALFFCRPSIPVDFNDSVKYTVNSSAPWKRFLVGCLPAPLHKPFMTVHVSERVVEIPFVFANLRAPKGATVVDLGCFESRMSLELANRGYRVLASDLRPYPFAHPNLHVLTGDFAVAPIQNDSVDAVIAISTLEHIGLSCYGKGSEKSSDHAVVRKIQSVLKRGGQFLLTVPFGVRGQTGWYRVYDKQSLSMLLVDFELEKIEFYRRTAISSWEETTEQCAAKVESPVEANCVALVAAVAREGVKTSTPISIG